MLIGTNCDGAVHGFVPADIARSGVRLVRFPISLGIDYGSFIAGLLGAQIEPVYVFHSSSFTPSEWLDQTFLRRLRWWAKGLPDPKYIQAGNEPDGTGASSSKQSKKDYWRLIRNCQTVWPNATIIAGGLVGIDFSYLDGIPRG